MMSTDYLPEYIIYLWKKLILNKDGQFNGTLRIIDFRFFNDDERDEAKQNFYKKSKDTMKLAAKVYSIIDLTPQFISEKQTCFFFDERFTFGMFFGGLSNEPAAIRISDIRVDSAFLRTRTICDCTVPISDEVYRKIYLSQELTISEAFVLENHKRIFEYLSFKIRINKRNLKRYINDYIELWETGDMKPPKDLSFVEPAKQKKDYLRAMAYLEKKYGRKMIVSSDLLAKACGWYLRNEFHYRFFETMFSLERSGLIEINDIIKETMLITLMTDVTAEMQKQPVRNEMLHVTKNGDDFYYKGKLLKLSRKTDCYRVFSSLHALIGQGGEVDYSTLGREVQSRIAKAKRFNKSKMQKFIQTNLTDRRNGFMHYAGIPDTEDNGKPLIAVNRGTGIIFNNRAG